MGKVEDMRALRESRFAERQKSQPARQVTAKKALSKAIAATEPGKPKPDELCGHRSISGKSCTRELGHSQKNHRYS